jgi:hypothetical protein
VKIPVKLFIFPKQNQKASQEIGRSFWKEFQTPVAVCIRYDDALFAHVFAENVEVRRVGIWARAQNTAQPLLQREPVRSFERFQLTV